MTDVQGVPGAAGVPGAEPLRTDRALRLPTWVLQHNRWWARWLIRRRFSVTLHGVENVPASGPVVLASNHVGVVDGPLLAIFSPRPAHALTKIEMFQGPLGWFLRLCGQIPLDRFHTDPRAVKASVRALREGLCVGIFPEGTRGSGELERFHRGAAYLALVTGAPVVPVTMIGTRAPGGSSSSLPPRRGAVDMVYGTVFRVDAERWPRTRARVEQISLDLRSHMRVQIDAALAATGRTLPGPLPAGDAEPDPGDNLTERSA